MTTMLPKSMREWVVLKGRDIPIRQFRPVIRDKDGTPHISFNTTETTLKLMKMHAYRIWECDSFQQPIDEMKLIHDKIGKPKRKRGR